MSKQSFQFALRLNWRAGCHCSRKPRWGAPARVHLPMLQPAAVGRHLRQDLRLRPLHHPAPQLPPLTAIRTPDLQRLARMESHARSVARSSAPVRRRKSSDYGERVLARSEKSSRCESKEMQNYRPSHLKFKTSCTWQTSGPRLVICPSHRRLTSTAGGSLASTFLCCDLYSRTQFLG